MSTSYIELLVLVNHQSIISLNQCHKGICILGRAGCQFLQTTKQIHVSSIRINLHALAFYHKCCPLIGYATHVV